jgi:UDP-N-acetylglucosamine transferase subunit ALG13
VWLCGQVFGARLHHSVGTLSEFASSTILRFGIMIFVTVGSQLPFDRLVKGIDQLTSDLSVEVFAQIGEGSYEPSNFPWERLLTPTHFNELVKKSTLIVSHAGIGSVLSAQRWGKPILIFPRLASHGEHRNDHQLATLRALKDRDGIYTAETISEIGEILRRPLLAPPRPHHDSAARANLKANLARIIRKDVVRK